MRSFILAALTFALLPAQEKDAEDSGNFNKTLDSLINGKGAGRFFYYPTKTGPHTPDKWGYVHEEVTFKSGDETKLHGWFIKPKMAKPRGAIVFSHGNAGAVGYHLGFITWAVNAGYQVLLYDYRGFGLSEGRVDRAGIVSDVSAAIAYTQKRPDVDENRVFAFGHSLGGAKSIAALGSTPVKNLKGVICFAGFSSYQKMAKKVAGNFGSKLIDDEWAPRDFVAKLAPIPLLIVHGDQDQVVPYEQGKELFDRAKQPKTLFTVKGGRHNNALHLREKETIKRILQWMDRV